MILTGHRYSDEMEERFHEEVQAQIQMERDMEMEGEFFIHCERVNKEISILEDEVAQLEMEINSRIFRINELQKSIK